MLKRIMITYSLPNWQAVSFYIAMVLVLNHNDAVVIFRIIVERWGFGRKAKVPPI